VIAGKAGDAWYVAFPGGWTTSFYSEALRTPTAEEAE